MPTPTPPTVSSVAITSSPGDDGEYTTLDVIEATVTFSEAVTVTGTPQLMLAIGSNRRAADYVRGSGSAALVFAYEVHPTDQDDIGIGIPANALRLSGGTIDASGTTATLTHAAVGTTQRVDTEIVLLSNTGQPDGTPLRIEAGESYRFTVDLWDSQVVYELDQLVFDVKTASETLVLDVATSIDALGRSIRAKFVGSVSMTGKQTFRSEDFTTLEVITEGRLIPLVTAKSAARVEVTLTATGSGFIELRTTASKDEDAHGAYRWTIGDSLSKLTDGAYVEHANAHLPSLNAIGHAKEVVRILASHIVSEPLDGVTYRAGERIEARIHLNHPVRAVADPLTVPLLFGDERRLAELGPLEDTYQARKDLYVFSSTARWYFISFFYTVQPGDTATGGVALAADPLGDGSDGRVLSALGDRVRLSLSAPAVRVTHNVDGSSGNGCEDVHCAQVTSSTDRGASLSVYTGLYPPETLVVEFDGSMTDRSFTYDQRYTITQIAMPASDDQSEPDLLVYPPLSAEALARLALQTEEVTLPLRDAEREALPPPASEEYGEMHRALYWWTGVRVVWLKGQRNAVRFVEVPVSVSFNAASYAAGEGETITVTVTLGAAFRSRSATVPITVEGNGGATSADYSLSADELVFAAGDTAKTFTVTLTDDTRDDEGETLTLGFGDSPDITSGGTNETATVTITDNDPPEVSFAAATYDVEEDSSVDVGVTLSSALTSALTVPVTATNQTGASTGDYTVGTSVTFSAGTTTASLTLEATSDIADDAGEKVQLSLGVLPSGVQGGSITSTVVRISDNSDTAVSVSLGASTYTAGEGASATVTATLSSAPGRSVVVPLVAVPQGSTTAADYAVPESITFGSTDTTKTFEVAATQDDIDDDGESVKVQFGTRPPRVNAGTITETTVSITDDDDPIVEVSFGALTYNADEGGTASVVVELGADPERSVTVPIEATKLGGATDADYMFASSVAFASGETSKTLTFTAIDDDVDDDGESVKLAFGSLPARVNAGDDETVVTIADDDHPHVTVAFSAKSYDVPEGLAVQVDVEVNVLPERDLDIPLVLTGGGGATTADYALDIDGSTVSIDEDEKTVSFRVVSPQDDIDDDDEFVTLSLNLAGLERVTAGKVSEAVVNIVDDDSPELTVTFDRDSYSTPEGTAVDVVVELSADPERTVTILTTRSPQGGASDDDYSGVLARLIFMPRQTRQTFTFMATQDQKDDDGESVQIEFGTLAERITEGATPRTVVSIDDDDEAGVTVSDASLTILEGESERYTVVIESEPLGTVTVTPVSENPSVTVSPPSLTFTAQNWQTPQTVSATVVVGATGRPATISHTVAQYGSVTTAPDVAVAVEILPTPTPTPTPTATPKPRPTATPTPRPSPTPYIPPVTIIPPVRFPTATPTPEPTATPTATATPTSTPTSTPTLTPTPSPTPSPVPVAVAVPTSTPTPTVTPTPTPAATPTPLPVVDIDEQRNGWWWLLLLLLALLLAWIAYRRWRRRKRRWGERRWYG